MTQPSRRTLDSLAAALAAGETSSRALVEDCLARIADPAGEGARAFLGVDASAVRSAADRIDARRRRGEPVGRYAGIPVSVKDLFDLAGEVTTAGSRVLADAAPAASDAAAVARLRSAGFLPIGRTNMTEFAFSGLGLNPHYGTPRNPWDRAASRIPGGSSSGAAVSVADGMALAALGTDTGGSCRIPAAFCGIVGFKPTARRVPLEGVYPLSPTLDSVGPLAATVGDCAVLDALLADVPGEPLPAVDLGGLRLGVPERIVLDGLEPAVATAFERALQALSRAGAKVKPARFEVLSEVVLANRRGGFAAYEALQHHRALIERAAERYDPRVLRRIERGAEQTAAEYADLHRVRAALIERAAATLADCDAWLMPSVAIVAPRIEDLAADEDYLRQNALVLRNTSLVNFLDGCALSLPCHAPGEAPVGLGLFAAGGSDRRLLAIGAAVEACVGPA